MFPPSALAGWADDEVLTAFERWMRCALDLSANGIWAMCRGKTAGTLVRHPEDIQIKAPVDPSDFPSFELGLSISASNVRFGTLAVLANTSSITQMSSRSTVTTAST